MRVMSADYEILTPISVGGIDELKNIEAVARTCYKSEDKIKDDGSSAKALIKNLIKNGHEAMLEHSQLSVKFYVDRGISHEEVRHRLASFAQESTRYVNYSGAKAGSECACIDIFPGMKLDAKCMHMFDNDSDDWMEVYKEWEEAMKDAERHYMRMMELGASAQIARGVLPNSTKTEIVITANYREWRNIFKLRADMPAHPQMREVMVPLLMNLKEQIPVIFDDIEPYWGVDDDNYEQVRLKDEFMKVHEVLEDGGIITERRI